MKAETCSHIFQHLQQHVLGLINQFSSLDHQLSQAQVAVQDCADQPTLKVTLNGLHLHKWGQQACMKTETVKKEPQALKKFQIKEFNFIDPDQIGHRN